MKHAARFGNGAYLAEDIEKSLTYTEEDDQGYRASGAGGSLGGSLAHMSLCRFMQASVQCVWCPAGCWRMC